MECHSRVFFVAQLFLVECKHMILRPQMVLPFGATSIHFIHFGVTFFSAHPCTSQFLFWKIPPLLVHLGSFFTKCRKTWNPTGARPWPPCATEANSHRRPSHVPWEKKLPRSWWRCLSHYGSMGRLYVYYTDPWVHHRNPTIEFGR